MKLPRALLLDLDGTLIDSAPDIADALNATLIQLGREALTEARVRAMIGNGVAALVRAALEATGGLPDAALQELAVAEMTRRYGAVMVARTILLPGAEALFSACQQLRIAIVCITNKPADLARGILKHFGLLDRLALVIGGDGEVARKPAPDGLLAAIATLQIQADAAWMVGDSMTDVLAARGAGVRMVAVQSDYGEVPLGPTDVDIYLPGLDELAELLLVAERPS